MIPIGRTHSNLSGVILSLLSKPISLFHITIHCLAMLQSINKPVKPYDIGSDTWTATNSCVVYIYLFSCSLIFGRLTDFCELRPS